MRRNRSLLLLLAATAAGCSDTAAPIVEREPVRAFTLHEAQVADATIGFGLKLFREVATHELEKPNLMVSPLSVSVALGMVMNGAAGSTYDAMRNTLGFGTLEEPAINAAYRGLTEQLYARAARTEFNLVNSIWYDREFTPLPAFIDAAKTHFDAEVTALDFGDPNAPKTISAWAERETRGRIKDLVEQLEPEEVMMLVNATYFKAEWRNRFDERKTTQGAFVRADGSQVSVPMMRISNDYRTGGNQDAIAVELLYADTAFSMVLLMPTGARSVETMVAQMTPAWWQALINGMRVNATDLVLPRFKFDYKKTLNDPLTALGMGIAFGPGANLSRIAASEISRVLHKTFIETNEEGSEAAAATAIGIRVVSAGPQFVFNRPFLFAIRERNSGAILFIGKVGDPSKN